MEYNDIIYLYSYEKFENRIWCTHGEIRYEIWNF